MDGTIVESEGEAAMNRELGNARVVKLKSGRPGPCLFLVPGIGGRIEGFGNLAELPSDSDADLCYRGPRP